MSSSSPLSHLERFGEGVEDPTRIGTIGISGSTAFVVTFLEAFDAALILMQGVTFRPTFFPFSDWTQLGHVLLSSRSTKGPHSSVSMEDAFYFIAPKISFHGRVIKPKFCD